MLKKYLLKWLHSGSPIQPIEVNSPRISPRPELDMGNGIHFTIYRANGGYVLESKTYDKKVDRIHNKLHIITDDKDLGDEIAKIITFEHIRS